MSMQDDQSAVACHDHDAADIFLAARFAEGFRHRLHRGGAYQTTTPMSGKFRDWIRAVAQLTSDDELLRIAELPEVPVSLENCRQLDPQTRFVTVCRLDVSAAETPRHQRITPPATGSGNRLPP